MTRRPRYLHALSTAYLAAGDSYAASRDAAEALRRAREHKQTELAARIEHRSSRLGCRRGDGQPSLLVPPVCCSDPAGFASFGGDTPSFANVAAETGLRFQHVNGAAGRYHLPEIMGAGGALFDFDGDGDLDVFLLQGRALDGERCVTGRIAWPSSLSQRSFAARRRRFASFHRRDRACRVRRGRLRDGRGGRRLRQRRRPGHLRHELRSEPPVSKQRDGTFTDVTARAGNGLDDPRWSTSATFSDYDADGDLDLFRRQLRGLHASRAAKSCFGPAGVRDYCGPLQFRPVPDRLFRNNGNGTLHRRQRLVGHHRSGRTWPRRRRRRSQRRSAYRISTSPTTEWRTSSG